MHLRDVPDRGDPVFSAWRIARVAHQLRTDPARLFDGNIFYPRRWTLAYSDATLLEAFAGAPFVLAGLDPLTVANALFLVALPLCALAFFLAAWRLTRDPAAALVAGVLGALYPFHVEHYSHLELQWFMLAPVALVAALEAIRAPGWKAGLVLAMAVGLQCLASMYLGLMLAAVLVPFCAVAVIRGPRGPARDLARALVAAAIVVVPLVVLLAIPYQRARAEHGERGAEEIAGGSAVPGDYLKTPRRLAAYAWHDREFNRPERELFPGSSTLLLASIGVVAAPADVALPLAAAGAAALDWSFGVHGVSYRALLATLPPFRSVRVPARFAALVGTVLVLLGAFGATWLLARAGPRRRAVVTIALVCGVMIDLRPSLPLIAYYRTIPAAYERLGPGAVVATLPAGHEIDAMYFSTAAWPALLGGYSGFIPADPALASADAAFPSEASVRTLASLGATHIAYNCAFERSATRCATNAATLARNPALQLISSETWQGSTVRLYHLAGTR